MNPLSTSITGACAILVLLLSGFVVPSESQALPWQGNVELGYMMSTGNTESRTLNARLEGARETPQWLHRLQYETKYSHETDEGTTAQRFLVSGRTNYRLDERNAIYGLALYENDRFSGYNYQVTLSTGYNRRIIDTDRTEWSAEIGPGFRYSNFREEGRSSEEEPILHMGTLFLHRFTPTIAFEEELTVDSGDEFTIIRSLSSFRVTLTDNLSLRLSFMIRHLTDVPEDTENTDTETFLSLAYGF